MGRCSIHGTYQATGDGTMCPDYVRTVRECWRLKGAPPAAHTLPAPLTWLCTGLRGGQCWTFPGITLGNPTIDLVGAAGWDRRKWEIPLFRTYLAARDDLVAVQVG